MLLNFNSILENSWTKINNKTWRQRCKSRETSKNSRPCCFATGSCALASLPETHFTTGKELILLRRLKFAFLPMKRSLDLAEDLATTPMNLAMELQWGSTNEGCGEPHFHGWRSHSRIANLKSLSSLEINNQWESVCYSFVCFLSCSQASLGVSVSLWVCVESTIMKMMVLLYRVR